MKLNEVHISFVLRLLFFTSFVFGAHLFTLNLFQLNLFEALLLEAYAINIFFAAVIYALLFLARNKFRNQLGFVFLVLSMLKFLLVFLLFKTFYLEDNIISRQEFFAFFIPYVTTLVIEVYSISKWLNKLSS